MNIKTCCGCPDGKEIIYCGCGCHKEGKVRVKKCKVIGEVTI